LLQSKRLCLKEFVFVSQYFIGCNQYIGCTNKVYFSVCKKLKWNDLVLHIAFSRQVISFFSKTLLLYFIFAVPTKHIDPYLLALRIKQDAAAQELAIRQSAYSDIENGKTEVKVSQLCKLACLFGKDITDFFDDTPH